MRFAPASGHCARNGAEKPAGIARGLRPGVCWGRYGDSAEGTPALATVARAGGRALARASRLRVVAGPAHPAALSHSLDRSRRRADRRGVPGANERWLSVAGCGRRTVPLRWRSLRAHRQHSRPAAALQQHHDVVCAALAAACGSVIDSAARASSRTARSRTMASARACPAAASRDSRRTMPASSGRPPACGLKRFDGSFWEDVRETSICLRST